MRLFTGLDLPPRVAGRIDEFIQELKAAAPVRWSRVENLHVTTKFIGEWSAARIDELKQALAGIRQAPFTVEVAGLGIFPDKHAPRIFWAGVTATAELRALASATELVLEPLGIAREDRPYSPHLTLARIAGLPAPVEDLFRHTVDFGTWEAREFHLYESRDSVYSKLGTFALK